MLVESSNTAFRQPTFAAGMLALVVVASAGIGCRRETADSARRESGSASQRSSIGTDGAAGRTEESTGVRAARPAVESPPATFEGSQPASTATEPEAARSPVPSAVPRPPGAVFYVDPSQYSAQRAAFTKDAAGNVRLNTILLPAEVPQQPSIAADNSSAGYAGAAVCGECHRERLEGFQRTSHFHTSAEVSAESVLGDFVPPGNRLTTASPDLSIEMLIRDGEYYQRLLLDSGGETLGADFPIHLVTGSGKVAQTYLYWKGELLFQLHATYLKTAESWVNSPGFEDGVANFARPVHAVCLECHATYFQPVEGTTNQFKRDNFIVGVTCERCHGPAAAHVAHHRQHPQATDAKHVVNPGRLPTELQLDVCQVCHGGMPTGLKQPPLTFRPGESLADYYEFSPSRDEPSGTHTNSQLPRLQLSRCFQASPSMTCVDCHDPHRFERGDTRLFSARCIECHPPAECGAFERLGDRLSENCIDCHMPPIELDDITFHTQGTQQSPTMRDHFIGVWPEAVDRFYRESN